MPLAALRSRALGAANLGAFAFQAATNAPLLLCILALQDLQGRTPVETGLAFAPFNAAVIAGSLAFGRLLARAGHGAVLAVGLVNTTGELGYAVGLALLVTLATAVTGAVADGQPARPADVLAGYDAAFAAAAGATALAVPLALALLSRADGR